MPRSLLIFVIAVLTVYATQAQVSFDAITEVKSILEGSTFVVRYKLANAEGRQFQAPDFTPFTIVGGPNKSVQTTIINGVMTSSVSYSYSLLANKVGTFEIPPASMIVQGRTLKSNSLRISVVKSQAGTNRRSDDKGFFILAEVDTSSTYLGQQLNLTYTLYTRVNLENLEILKSPELQSFQFEYISTGHLQAQTTVYKGQNYTTKLLSRIILFPIKTGWVEIAPVIYRVGVAGESNDDPFGFSMPSFFNTRIENIQTNPLRIFVKDLPKPAPASFSGAVGDFSASISKIAPSYNLSDAIQIKLDIRGNGNLDLIQPSLISSDSLFESSAPKTGDIVKVGEDPFLVKARSYEFLLTPKKSGEVILVPAFSYFDPAKGKYITFSDSLDVKINATTHSSTREDQSSSDIVFYPHVDNGSGDPDIFNKWYAWLALGLILGIYLIPSGKVQSWLQKNQVSPTAALKSKNAVQGSPADRLEQKLVKHLNTIYPHHHFESLNYESKEWISSSLSPESPSILNLIQEWEYLKYSKIEDKKSWNDLEIKIDKLS
jgi:hypothetical protein